MAGYKLPKVTQYVKNVGKSIAYASIDAVKANTRGVSDFIDVNNDVFKEVYASAKNIRATIKNTEKQVRQSNLYKAIDIGVKNLIEDAKTGNFYRDRTEDYAESIIGLDDEFDMEFQSGSSEGASQKTLSDSINNAVGAAAISQNTAIAEGTGLIIKSNSANTKLMMASMEKISANFSAGMGAVYTGINATNQFLNGPMMAHLENSRRYYEETSKQLRDQSMMLKEMLEMQRNLYKKQSIDEKETRLAQSMTGTGGMNIRGYAKNVKSNIKDYMDSMGLSMFDMGGGGNPYLMFAASPFKLLLEPVAQRLMSPDFKKALRSFDKGINTFFSQLVAKLNNARDNSFGFGQIIGEIFGIKLDRKESINPGNYQKGAVPFDGVTRQAIIEVIPGYLSRIEAALTHSGERHYDHTSGTWKSAKRIQKNFEEEENRYITQANSGWLDALAPMTAEIERGNKKKAKELKSAAAKMARKIYKDGGDFDPNRGGAYYGISDDMFDRIVQNMPRDVMRNIASDTMRAIQNRSSAMRAHEANGGPYRQLFNGAYDMEGKGNGSKNLPGDFKKNNLLTLATDSTGKNVFYYLREILGNISKRHSSQKGSMKGAIKVRRHSSQSSSTSGSSASSSNSADDDSDPDPDDDAFWESYDAEQKAKAEENKKQEKKAKMQDWIKTKMGNSPIGKVLGNMLGGAVNVLAKPMEYATKLLKKADEGMFQMMFGNKEYKLRNGEEATSVFQYIIDQVKGTFEELKDSIKKMFTNIYQKYLEPMLKPLWEKYGKPVADELKNMGKRAGARVKTAFGNTFGRAYKNVTERMRNGEVVPTDEVVNAAAQDEGVQESAFGRIVTKRGLTMISPGEIIIPASFDKREQNRMLALEKRDKKRILNAIQYNAKGTVDTEGMKDELRKIYNDNIGKAPKNIASGIVGAGAGLLSGINPLLGAAAGAGLSILSNSETLKSAIFGKEILEDGTREGGFVSNKIQKFFKKAMPDIGDFGIAGGLLGLLTPFGPLGGAAIGAGIGMLKNSEGFKKFIFGDAETGKDGLISKETYDKVVDKIKGSVPNIAVGAVGGALLGPFGILGNAVMGAGLGLLSSTDTFHKFIFGHAKGEKHEKGTPRKGLLGALERGIIDPAKEKITEILDDFKKFAKKHVIEPLKRFWDPFQQMVKNLVSNVTNGIKDKLNDIFEKTIGIPIADFLQQKIFKPLTKTFFTILKAPYTLMKGAIAAPAHLLGFTGDNIRANQIRKGTAHNMTAEERLAWMQEHGVRNAMSKVKNARAAKKYGISFEERDRAIMGMNAEDQEKMMSMLQGNLNSMESLQRERGKARRMVGDEISTFFNTKDENGKLRYDKVGYGKVKRKLAQWAADGDFEKVEEWIKNANLSDQEKKDLMKSIKPYMQNAKQANDAMSSAREGGAGLDEQLEKLFGRKMNRRGKRNVMEALKAEINARKQSGGAEETVSEEKENTDATNELNQTINDRAKEFNDRTKDILEALKDLNSNLAEALKRQRNSNANAKRRKKGKGITEVATEAAEGIAGLLPTTISPIGAEDIENATENAKGGFFKKKGLSMVSKGETILPSFMSKFFKKFDKDSKEAVEERQAEEKARKAEEEETVETKKTNSILMKLHDKFFGEKEENKKDGLGILSKLGSGFSKFSKFLGVGGKVALGLGGVSLFGHATEWFKTKVWPIMKTGLFGEDGSSGLIGGFVTRAKNWFESGGFHKLLSDKIIPSFITGLSYTMENVVGPAIALLIKHLPSILWGLAKGLFKGLKSLVFKDKMDGQEEKEMLAASGFQNSKAFLDDFSKMNGQKSKALENNMSSEMKKQLSGVTAGNTIAYGVSNSLGSGLGSGESKSTIDPTTNTSSTVTNNYITQNASKFGDGELENPNETLTVQANGPMGLLGRRKNTNIVRYDENGNVLTMYDTRNTQESALSAAAKAAGLSFRKGLFSGKGSSKILNAVGNMKWAKPKAGIVGNILGGTKNTVKAGAKGINFFGNLGDKIHNKLYGSIIDDSRDASGLNEWFKTHGGEAAANYAESRNIQNAAMDAAGEVAEGAAKTGAKKGIMGSIKNAWNKTIGGKMANSSSKILQGAAENVAEKGVVKGLASTAASKAKDGVKSVVKMAGDAIDSSAITKGLKEVFEKIAGSAVVEKICGFAKKILKKAVDPSIVQDAIRVIGTQIAEKCVKGAAKTAVKEATEQIANACTMGLGTIAFFVADFLWGYNNAYTLLGVAKGSEFEVNIGHKCACGLVHAIVNLIPFVGGFIPTNVLMQLIMEKILPIFGYDPSALQAAQEESSKILDEWNKAHPDEQYDNLEDFNNKDKWTTKAGKWIKEKAGAAWNKTKEVAGKAGGWIKDKATAAGSWIKDKASKGKELVTKGFTAVADKTKEVVGNAMDIGGFIKDVTTNVVKSATDPEFHWDIDSYIKEDDPLGGAKKTIYQVLKVPLGVVGVVSMVGKKIFDKVKGFVLNVKDGFGDAWGDISNVIKGQYSVFNKEYWKFNDGGEDGENPLGSISKVASTMLKVISIPHSMLGYVGSKIWQGIKALISGAKEGTIDASSDIKAVASGQYTIFNGNYWKSDNEDSENPLSTMGSIFGFVTRLFSAPSAMMGYVGTKIMNGIKAVIAGSKEGALDASSDIEAVKKGQYTIFNGNYWKSDNTDDGNELSIIGKIASFVTRLFNAPSAMMGYVGTKVVQGIKAIIAGAKEGALDASSDIEAVKKGEYTIFNGNYWKSDSTDDSNPLSGIGKVASFVTRLFNAPQAMIGWVGTKVKAGFDAIVSGAKEGALDASSDIEAVKKGEYTIFSKDYWKSDNEDDSNPLSKIGSIAAFITRLSNAPGAMIGYVMTKVKETFTKIIDGAKDIDEDNKKVIEKAEKGDISVFSKDYWNMPDTENNPLGMIGTIGAFIQRLVNAPIVLLKSVFKKIQDKFGEIAGWFKKLFGEEDEEGGSGKGGYGRKRYGFARYSQLDPSISGMQYNGHTIGQAGCGPVAAANLINNIKGGNVSVQDTANYATAMGYKPKNDGTNPKYMNSILSASGIPNETVGRSGIDRSLKQGDPVVIMGRGNSPSSPYGNQNPHYITAMGYDRNGNVIVDDPYENGYKTYKKSDVVNGAMRSVSAKRNGFGRVFGRKLHGFKYGMARSATNPADVIHQNLGSWSPMTEEEMNAWINANCSGKNSTFIGNGKVFIDAANKTGLDPRYILAHAALESGWGISKISRDKNNYFGIGAFDASPYQSAYSFGSGIAAGIIGGAEWIRKNYYDSSYKQTTLYKMRFNNNVHQYATDPEWANKIATIMAKCPVPNTKITYDESQVSWDGTNVSIGSSNSTGGSSTLLSQFSNLGTSMVKAMFGEDAYNAFYGQNASTDATNGGVTAASGTVEKFVQSALNEEGYVEKASNSNLDDKTANPGSSNYTKYGKHFGNTGPGWPWCAQFVSWSADQAGIPNEAMQRSASCSQIETYFKNQNRFHYKNGYTPKRGDVVLFTSGGSSHVGIVTGMKDGQVKTIEGNTSNKVAQRSYSPNDAKITGYGDLGLGAATGTTGLDGSTSTTNAYGKGGYGKGILGTAKSALMANSAYQSGTTSIPARTSAPVSAGGGAVDYATFLQTIVTVLMNIADNTALLGKVLEILSSNFGINIDKTDIDKAKSKTKAQTEKALTDLVNKTNGNTVGVSKLLNNKDTEYIVAAMRAIATE